MYKANNRIGFISIIVVAGLLLLTGCKSRPLPNGERFGYFSESPEGIEISVYKRGKRAKPAKKASVLLHDLDSGTISELPYDPKRGLFRQIGWPTNRYIITMSLKGFETQEYLVDRPGSSKYESFLLLKPDDPYYFDRSGKVVSYTPRPDLIRLRFDSFSHDPEVGKIPRFLDSLGLEKASGPDYNRFHYRKKNGELFAGRNCPELEAIGKHPEISAGIILNPPGQMDRTLEPKLAIVVDDSDPSFLTDSLPAALQELNLTEIPASPYLEFPLDMGYGLIDIAKQLKKKKYVWAVRMYYFQAVGW